MSEQQPDAGQPTPPEAPQPPPPQTFAPPQPAPYGVDPYAAPQQQVPAPYGVQQPQYGAQPPYGAQPQYGGQPPYGGLPYGVTPQPAGFGTPPYGGYPQPAPTSGWTIGLVVVSAFCLFFALIGVPSLIIGIIALTKARTEPADARRLTWIGWLVLGVLFLLLVAFFVIVIAIAVSSSSTDDGTTIGTLGTTLRPRALRST